MGSLRTIIAVGFWLCVVCLRADRIDELVVIIGSEVTEAFDRAPDGTLTSIELPLIEGGAVGDGGVPGSFYSGALELVGLPDDTRISALLRSSNPVIRLLGAQVMILREKFDPSISALKHDGTPVVEMLGCVKVRTTIGSLVTKILENPKYLEFGFDSKRQSEFEAGMGDFSPPPPPPPKARS